MDYIRVGKTFDVTSELIGDANFSRPNLTNRTSVKYLNL